MAREHVGECRPWPQHFREKKALCGLAAAAIVSVTKNAMSVEGEARLTSSDVPHCLGTYPYGAGLGKSNANQFTSQKASVPLFTNYNYTATSASPGTYLAEPHLNAAHSALAHTCCYFCPMAMLDSIPHVVCYSFSWVHVICTHYRSQSTLHVVCYMLFSTYELQCVLCSILLSEVILMTLNCHCLSS